MFDVRVIIEAVGCQFRKTSFFLGIPFRSVPFRASELALPRNSECLGMSTFFRGITEIIPSLFRGIFSERNSVPNPNDDNCLQIFFCLFYGFSSYLTIFNIDEVHKAEGLACVVGTTTHPGS